MSKKNDAATASFKRMQLLLQGKLNRYLLGRYPHHVVPGLNLNRTPWVEQWDLENVMKLYRRFPYKSDLPKPLLPPAKLPKSVICYGDPATDIIATKNYIEEDANKILDNFQKHQKEHAIQLKKDVRWTAKDDTLETDLPRYIADLADIIEMDPDTYFEGKYNWYYTGGSLDSVKFGGEFILFLPYVGELVALPLSLRDNGIWKPTLKKAAKCNIDDTLHELRHNATSESCRVLARSKYECTFFSITECDSRLYMIVLDSKKSKVPYLSADLNSFDINQYCTLNFGRSIQFWDMVSGKCMNKGTINSTKCFDDQWGCVRYQTLNPSVVAYADRCCLHYIDSRERLETPVLSMCPKSHLNNCDNISLCMPSKRESRHYLGTTHSLIMCDDRSPSKCVHQKWTHQFESPPMLGSTLMRSGEEIIMISSQIPTDSAIILNTWENYDDPHSYCLPHKPPCMIDTLKECQNLGKCLDPSLRSRFDLSTVGCQLLMNDSQDVFIFLQNSVGDVFYQCITHDEDVENLPLINSYAYYALETWERCILKRIPDVAPLVVTDQVDMKHVFDSFSNASRKYKLGPPKEIVLDTWKQSLDRLICYVDILAPELLAAWEMSDEAVPASQAAPHQKVLTWLEMSSSKFSVTQSQESQGLPYSQESQGLQNSQESQGLQNSQESQGLQNSQESQGLQNSQESQGLQYSQQSQELPNSQELQDDPFAFLPPIESQELVSVSQQCTEVVEIDKELTPLQPVYLPLKTNTKPKEVKKKSQYVAGF